MRKRINNDNNRLSGMLSCCLTGLFVLLSLFTAKAQNHWTPNTGAFDNYMAITAYLTLNGQEVQSDQFEVGSFIDDECRGNFRLRPIEFMGHPYACFLPVWGSASDNGKPITFKVYDHATQTLYEVEQKPVYEYNGDLGTLAPIQLTLIPPAYPVSI